MAGRKISPYKFLSADVRETIGTRIRTARKAKGMSQERLGRSARVYQPVISNIERGLFSGVPFVEIEKMCEVLEVPTDQIIHGLDLKQTERSLFRG